MSEPRESHAGPPVPLADGLDALVRALAQVMCWANALLIIVIISQVAMRYGFESGLIALEELQWHLYAIAVMFGISYAQTEDVHVRVDIFYARLSDTARRLWDIFGILVLLLPFIWIVFHHSLDFVYDAWRIGETSDAPSGLPYRWAIKAVIPLSFALLFIAALSRLIRDIALLTRKA